MNKIAILFIISFLYSCGAGVSEFTEDLGNGYIYESFGQDSKSIRSPVNGQKNIYGKVVQYKYDKKFILVIQQPNREVYKYILGEEIISKDRNRFPNHSIDDITEGKRIADSLIQHDTYYKTVFEQKINYWIISHQDKQMYGPLTEEKYYQIRNQLKVPAELRLDTTKEYN